MPVKYHNALRNQHKIMFDHPNDMQALKENAASLVKRYSDNPEESLVAQIQFYQEMIDGLNQYYNEQIYQKKSWWQTFLYYIGWLDNEESDYLSVIKDAKHQQKIAKKLQNPLSWYDKLIWYICEGIVQSKLNEEDDHKSLRYLSHRTLLNVKNVPDYLEGISSNDSFKDYHQDLQDFLDTTQTSVATQMRIQGVMAQLQRCHESEQALILNKGKHLLFEQLNRNYDIQSHSVIDRVFEVIDTMANLSVGEKALFNHGFLSKEGAHGTTFEVEKVNSNSVRFRFYNTGAGTHGTASWATLLSALITEQSSAPIKVTDPLPLSFIFDSDFIEQLVSPTIIAADTVEEGVKRMNKPLLDLYRSKKLHDDQRKIRHQLMGSCGQSSIDAWVETQLNELEFIQFYCYRLKQSIDKIDVLQETAELTEEQKSYCQHMRLAAQVELDFLGMKLVEIIERMDNDVSQSLKTLQAVRVENAASKGKEPKSLSHSGMDAYCQKKLDEHRLADKFSIEEQQSIKYINKDSSVMIHYRAKDQSNVSRFTMGLFGQTSKKPLSESERRDNKLAKTKLCQKIMGLKMNQATCRQLSSLSMNLHANKKEADEIYALVVKRKNQNGLDYADLSHPMRTI